MQSLIAHYGILMVALVIYGGEIGIPAFIPGEVALLIAGAQLVHSVPALVGAAIFFGLVDLAATSTIHCAARSGGNRLLLRLIGRFQPAHQGPQQKLEAWRHRLGRHDALVIFVTRLIPLVRFYASVTAGLLRFRLRDFIGGAAPAALIWAATPLVAGYLFRGQLTILSKHYELVLFRALIAALLLGLLGGLTWWLVRSSAASLMPRRLRVGAGFGMFILAFGRLMGTAVLGPGPAGGTHVFSMPALPLWVTVIAVAAIGLLWIAQRDLKVLRHQLSGVRSIRAMSAAAWIGLIIAIGLASTWGSPHALAL